MFQVKTEIIFELVSNIFFKFLPNYLKEGKRKCYISDYTVLV